MIKEVAVSAPPKATVPDAAVSDTVPAFTAWKDAPLPPVKVTLNVEAPPSVIAPEAVTVPVPVARVSTALALVTDPNAMAEFVVDSDIVPLTLRPPP